MRAFRCRVRAPYPLLSNGGVPFTPFEDQLPGTCRDYFAVDGWADYGTSNGHWLWVSRDAPLLSFDSPPDLDAASNAAGTSGAIVGDAVQQLLVHQLCR